MSIETVTVAKEEYENLQERDYFLCALEAAGVDNWEGYSEAQQMLREWYGESEDE